MSKSRDEMTISELQAEKDDGYCICRYIDERRAKEAGLPPPDNTPYDTKTECGEGVQGPR